MCKVVLYQWLDQPTRNTGSKSDGHFHSQSGSPREPDATAFNGPETFYLLAFCFYRPPVKFKCLFKTDQMGTMNCLMPRTGGGSQLLPPEQEHCLHTASLQDVCV